MIRTQKYLLALFLLFSQVVFSQSDSLLARIILIGDAGELHNGKNEVIAQAAHLFGAEEDQRTTIIYLGDNVYEYGLPDSSAPDFNDKKAVLDVQAGLVKNTMAAAYFIMGNHDWEKSRAGGWQRVLNQQHYINSLHRKNLHVLPENGCPGPAAVVLNDKVVVVFMDSQWWLHKEDKPGTGSGCPCKTETAVISALKEIVEKNKDKLLVLAMHHPFYTHGPHGGYYTIKQHIFPLTDIRKFLYIPLPVIGSIYPLVRGVFGTPQDTKHRRYRKLKNSMETVLKLHPNVVHVAGHEHNLQLLEKDGIHYMVSGAGSKNNRVKKGKYSLFAANKSGFSVIEVEKNGHTTLKYYGIESDQPLYSLDLNSNNPPPATGSGK